MRPTALLLVISGYFEAVLAGLSSPWAWLPLGTGLLLYLLDGLAGRTKDLLVLALMLIGGSWLISDLSGLVYLVAVVLLAGGLDLTAEVYTNMFKVVDFDVNLFDPTGTAFPNPNEIPTSINPDAFATSLYVPGCTSGML